MKQRGVAHGARSEARVAALKTKKPPFKKVELKSRYEKRMHVERIGDGGIPGIRKAKIAALAPYKRA